MINIRHDNQESMYTGRGGNQGQVNNNNVKAIRGPGRAVKEAGREGEGPEKVKKGIEGR